MAVKSDAGFVNVDSSYLAVHTFKSLDGMPSLQREEGLFIIMDIPNILGVVANIAQILGTIWTFIFGGARLVDVVRKIVGVIRKRKSSSPPPKKKNLAIIAGIVLVIISSIAALILTGTAIPFADGLAPWDDGLGIHPRDFRKLKYPKDVLYWRRKKLWETEKWNS